MPAPLVTLVRRVSAVVFAATAVIASSADPASARIRSGDRAESSVSMACGYLQDRWDQLARDLGTASRSGTQAEYDAVFGAMLETGRQWELLCRGDYGSIVFAAVPPRPLSPGRVASMGSRTTTVTATIG